VNGNRSVKSDSMKILDAEQVTNQAYEPDTGKGKRKRLTYTDAATMFCQQ